MSKSLTGSINSTDEVKEKPSEPAPTVAAHKRARYVISSFVRAPLPYGNSWIPQCRWQRVPFTSTKPPPPPKPSLDDSDLIPEATASFFSLLTFGWITDLLGLGYARPLEASDLYKLQDSRAAVKIADKINASYDRRLKDAREYNERLAAGEISPGWRAIWWTLKGRRKELEDEWRNKTGRKRPSLAWAINDSVKWWFWTAGLLKFISDTAQVTSPLVVKVSFALILVVLC